MNATEIDLTVSEKILLAAADLARIGHTPFTTEALAVAAWQRWPDTFGLKGFADKHPDSNKVIAAVVGERGMRRQGTLDKIAKKTYALSALGKARARRAAGEATGEPEPPREEVAELDAAQDRFLRRMLQTSAYRDQRESETRFTHASSWWGITGLEGDTVTERVETTARGLAVIAGRLEDAGPARLRTGELVTAAQVRALVNLDARLRERFAQHLRLLASRKAKVGA